MTEYVELYTRQHENSIYELVNKGLITNKELYVRLHMGPDANYFIERYQTFVKMAQTIVARPNSSHFPIWGSPCKEYSLMPEENSLVYHLRLPKEEVIYFDGLKWDYVLNYLYVPIDEADQAQHTAKLKALGIQSGHYLFQAKFQGMYEDLKKEVRQSWWRIFDVDHIELFNTQGNIWQIKPEWVQSIRHYGESLQEAEARPLNLQASLDRVKARQSSLSDNHY